MKKKKIPKNQSDRPGNQPSTRRKIIVIIRWPVWKEKETVSVRKY